MAIGMLSAEHPPACSLHDLDAVRRDVSLAAGTLSVVAYNWWVAVPFHHDLMPSANGFFSDLEASGQPDAAIMSHLDLAAGLLLVAALVIAGTEGSRRTRLEHRALIAFGVAGALGGRFSYACAEGTNATCRQLEWSLQLPLHHYIHMVAGVAAFATITVVLLVARRRTRNEMSPWATAYRLVAFAFAIGYPFLAAAYLTDRFGAFIEPVFFISFSVVVVAELLEPHRIAVKTPTSSERRSHAQLSR